jgi:phosphoketolase
VQSGQECWFVLYPKQVQSLFHAWTHPTIRHGEEEAQEVTAHQKPLTRTKTKVEAPTTLVSHLAALSTADATGATQAALSQALDDALETSSTVSSENEEEDNEQGIYQPYGDCNAYPYVEEWNSDC